MVYQGEIGTYYAHGPARPVKIKTRPGPVGLLELKLTSTELLSTSFTIDSFIMK